MCSGPISQQPPTIVAPCSTHPQRDVGVGGRSEIVAVSEQRGDRSGGELVDDVAEPVGVRAERHRARRQRGHRRRERLGHRAVDQDRRRFELGHGVDRVDEWLAAAEASGVVVDAASS